MTNACHDVIRKLFLSIGLDVDKLLNDIQDTIRSVYMTKEELLIKAANKFKSTRSGEID